MMYNGEIAYLQSGVQTGLIYESVDSLRNLLLLMVPIVLMLLRRWRVFAGGPGAAADRIGDGGARRDWSDESELAADGPAGGG